MYCQKTGRDEGGAGTGQGYLKWMGERQSIFLRVTTSGGYMWLEMLNTDSQAIIEVIGCL